MVFKVVYLTGAPASGKSSTAVKLEKLVPGLQRWEYGARLTASINERDDLAFEQTDIRRHSGRVITPADIEALDGELLAFVDQHRSSSHVLIDSHPVTKEDYGFRITAFSRQRFELLQPDEIWVLYTSPEVTVGRIVGDDEGRPMITDEEARMHTALQANVAATYAIAAGCPIYLFDTERNQDKLAATLAKRLG